MISRRRHPRATRRVVGHPLAPESPPPTSFEVEADHVDLYAPAVEVSRETMPGLPPSRVAYLEALTAQWVRDTQQGGPNPDATLLYAAPLPPPPPARPAPDPDPEPQPVTDLPEPAPEHDPAPVLEDQVPPPGPGRVVRDWSSRHDPRSLEYLVRDRLSGRAPVIDRLWEIGPVFDQGTTPPLSAHDASGCVGMAVAAAANVLALSTQNAYLAKPPGDLLTKDDALALYARAQQLDHVSGEDYPGTSVLAGMKAGQEAGLWPGYLWAKGTRDIAQALLQVGPVIVGIPWYDRLEEPDARGVVKPGGNPAGGHALALVGIRASLPGGPWFVAQQSRGPEFGAAGRILIHHRDLAQLLAGIGEAAVPIPPFGAPGLQP